MPERFESEALSVDDCWDLLSATVIGRLAVCLDSRPHIFPINYSSDRATITFRTASGTKLAGARNRHVAFEIDGYEPDTALAWSVIATGRAAEIDPDLDSGHPRDLPLFPWHVAPKAHFVRIVADQITGRRFRAVYAGPDGFRRGAAPNVDAPTLPAAAETVTTLVGASTDLVGHGEHRDGECVGVRPHQHVRAVAEEIGGRADLADVVGVVSDQLDR